MGDEGEFAVEDDLQVLEVVLDDCLDVLVEHSFHLVEADHEQVEEEVEAYCEPEALLLAVVRQEERVDPQLQHVDQDDAQGVERQQSLLLVEQSHHQPHPHEHHQTRTGHQHPRQLARKRVLFHILILYLDHVHFVLGLAFLLLIFGLVGLVFIFGRQEEDGALGEEEEVGVLVFNELHGDSDQKHKNCVQNHLLNANNLYNPDYIRQPPTYHNSDK